MSQDVNQDWTNREFIEQVEVGIRKCVDFLNNFHESARYRISDIDQRLNSLERKLDFTQAQLANCDPSKRGAQPKPFKNSVFDPEIRRQLIAKQNERREKSVNVFTDQVIAPKKSDNAKMIVGNARKQPNANPIQPNSPQVMPSKSVSNVNVDSNNNNASKDKDDKADANENNNSNNNNNRPPPPSPAQALADIARKPPLQPPSPPQPPPQPQQKEDANADNQRPAKFPHGKPDEIDILVIEPSNGGKPEPTSKVEIEYKGYLPNGEEFISHREDIVLGKKQNIKGLEMGICSMTVGSRVKLWIPSKLGYGPKGAPDLIPPDTDLSFDIILHKIHPN